jgi:hypothetical protein
MNPDNRDLRPDTKDISRGFSADMSSEAIQRRFAILQELNELCEWLGTAKPLGPVESDASPQNGEGRPG